MEPAAGRLRRSRRLQALGLEPAPESPREEPPAPESPREKPPAPGSPREEPPAAETPREEPPAAETPREEPPAAESPREEPPAAESPREKPPAAESPREESPALGPGNGHAGAPGEPGRGETLGVAPAPAPQRRNPAKKGKEVPAIPKGRPKSGRVWKDPGRRRFSHMIQDKPLHTSWEQKMKERQEKKIVKDFARYLKEEKQRAREEKKKRREENLKRRLENERKAEIVQVIRNPLKLKRTKKKQLRRIEKRDTLALLQKHQARRKEAKE